MDNRISGELIRLKNIKKSSKEINLDSLIAKTKSLRHANKELLTDLICYLNVALRSRYSGLKNDRNIKYFNSINSGNFKITEEGIKQYLGRIFHGDIEDDMVKTILSMCTHRHTTLDSVASFTKTAQQFFKKTNLEPDYKKLKDIKRSLDSGLKIKLPYDLFITFVRCSEDNLSHMNLSRANLSNATLGHVKLSEANLSGADLSGADLSGADLSGANLNNANLFEANLIGVNLARANLDGVNLDNIMEYILNRNLNTFKYSNSVKGDWECYNLLKSLNIIFNNSSASILTTISSIDNKYKDLKINLMNRVITWLKNGKQVHIHNTTVPLEIIVKIILHHNPSYAENEIIREFFIDKLSDTAQTSVCKSMEINLLYQTIRKFIINNDELAKKIKLAKIQVVVLDDVEISLLCQYINGLENNKKQFMLDNNALVNQIIYCSESSKYKTIKDMGRELKNSYFKLEEIQRMITNRTNYYWLPKEQENKFIFLYKGNAEVSFQGIIIDKECMTKFLYNKKAKSSDRNILLELIKSLRTMKFTDQKAQQMISLAIMNDKFEDKEVLLELVKSLGKLQFTYPEAQKTLAYAINDGEFGEDKEVLLELVKTLRTIQFTDQKAQQIIARAIKYGKFGNDREVLLELAKSLETMQFTNPEAQKTIVLAVRSNTFGNDREVLLELVKSLETMQFTDPEVQDCFAQAIKEGKFGDDKGVLLELVKSLGKLQFTDQEAQDYFAQAIEEGKFGDDKEVLLELLDNLEMMEFYNNNQCNKLKLKIKVSIYKEGFRDELLTTFQINDCDSRCPICYSNWVTDEKVIILDANNHTKIKYIFHPECLTENFKNNLLNPFTKGEIIITREKSNSPIPEV